jgi:hypothetical protein
MRYTFNIDRAETQSISISTEWLAVLLSCHWVGAAQTAVPSQWHQSFFSALELHYLGGGEPQLLFKENLRFVPCREIKAGLALPVEVLGATRDEHHVNRYELCSAP